MKKTYYDQLKATVYPRGGGAWNWEIRDSKDVLMASGTEFSLQVAYQEGACAVGAIRVWASVSRGVLTPATDGYRWFSFRSSNT